jgi:hypothetical protein
MDWTGRVGALGGAIVGGVTTYIALIKVLHSHQHEDRKQKQVEDDSVIGHYKDMAERLEKQNQRWQEDSDRKQKMIDELVERDTNCQVNIALYWGWMQGAQARIIWLTQQLRDKGTATTEIPALPEPPNPQYSMQFRARTSAQDTETLKATNKLPPAGTT